jgi:hypothetical protein
MFDLRQSLSEAAFVILCETSRVSSDVFAEQGTEHNPLSEISVSDAGKVISTLASQRLLLHPLTLCARRRHFGASELPLTQYQFPRSEAPASERAAHKVPALQATAEAGASGHCVPGQEPRNELN